MKRLQCLDGLRGILAVYVLLGHLAPFALLPGWLQSAVSHGGAAVDVFFVLSGLVITQSLNRAGGRAAPFLIARGMRIFPVFFVVFTVAVAVQPWSCGFDLMPWIGPDDPARAICVGGWPHDGLAEIAAHLTMTHGLFPAGLLPSVWVSFLGSAWSLSTEWQFYGLALMFPRQIHRFCWVLLGLALVGLAWQLAAPEAWQFSRAFLPNKGHFFALGVASVAVVRAERGAWLGYLPVLAASLLICATQGSAGKMLPPVLWTTCLLVQMRPAMGWTWGATRLLQSRWAQYLGAISYCLYLVNEPVHKIFGATLARLAGGDAMLFTLLWLPAAIGVPVVVAGALHGSLEVPAQRWGRRFAHRWSPADGVVVCAASRAGVIPGHNETSSWQPPRRPLSPSV